MATSNRTHSQLGFTIIELLVTISIIVILISMLTLALTQARTAAQIAETNSRLITLKKATIRFKDDIGYYPAVLDDRRHLAQIPKFPGESNGTPLQSYRGIVQDWYSITSPAEFFVGYGNQLQDGYGRIQGSSSGASDYLEVPAFGIRHPGLDGVWRGTDVFALDGASTGQGLISDRDPSVRGKLYGPYLELEDSQMFGRIAFDVDGSTIIDPVTGEFKVFYPGDADYDTLNPMVIVDVWGSPIRYYRSIYPQHLDPAMPKTGIAKMFPQSHSYDRPTLSDYFVLRPFDFSPNQVVDASFGDFSEGDTSDVGDTSTSMDLQAGQFAYFSAGPDKQANNSLRADILGVDGNTGADATDEVNKDNIVEIGP